MLMKQNSLQAEAIASILEDKLVEERICHPTRKAFVMLHTDFIPEEKMKCYELRQELEEMFSMQVKIMPSLHLVLMWESSKDK